MLKLDVSNISPRSDREATAGTLFQFIVYRNKKGTIVFEAQTFVQLGCEFVQNMAKFQCCAFGCLFIFSHIPEV